MMASSFARCAASAAWWATNESAPGRASISSGVRSSITPCRHAMIARFSPASGQAPIVYLVK